uniref:ATP synthase F(0) complex subunit f, mitochondrial n=2 Tax=Sus scrofa TaxID=9823 RepID=A0A4X1UEU3_PIG
TTLHYERPTLVPVFQKKFEEDFSSGYQIWEPLRWILMQDFTPKGNAGTFQRGYSLYYNEYVNVNKQSIAGLSMVILPYTLLNYCHSDKELKHERLCKYHRRGRTLHS